MTISAQLADTYGNPVATADNVVTWTKSNGHGSFADATSETDASGLATVVLTTHTVAGTTTTVTATTDALTGTSPTITTVPGPADATQSSLTPTSASITADGVSTQLLTVHAKDANGNDLSGGGATVTITRSSGTGSIGAVTDNLDGTYTATVTAPTATGSGVFVATLNANPVRSGGADQTQATVSYLAGPADASQSTVTAAPLTVTADGSATSTVTVTINDLNDNPVAGKTVTLLQTSGPGSPTIIPDSEVSNAAGVVGFTVSSTTAGADVFSAVDTTDFLDVTQTATVTFVAGPATQYLVSSNNYSPVAGADVTISAQLADAYGNPVATADKVVTWTKSNGHGSFADATSETDASGLATVVLTTHTVAGTTTTVTATTDALTGTSPTITTVPGPADATQSSLTPTSASITADGTARSCSPCKPGTPTATTSASGGATVTITRSSGTGSIGAVTDNLDGTYTATVTAPTATGSGVFVATLNANPVRSAGADQTQATVSYLAGPATQYLVSSGELQPGSRRRRDDQRPAGRHLRQPGRQRRQRRHLDTSQTATAPSPMPPARPTPAAWPRSCSPPHAWPAQPRPSRRPRPLP